MRLVDSRSSGIDGLSGSLGILMILVISRNRIVPVACKPNAFPQLVGDHS